MRVGVYHSRHDDAPRAVHNFRCLEAPLQILTCAHRHDPVLLDAYARAFEHFTPLVHRNQPRIGKNETHRRSPSRLGVKYLWDMVSGHRCGEWQIQRAENPHPFAARDDFPFPNAARSREMEPAPKVASANVPTPRASASSYLSTASGFWKNCSPFHMAIAISPARSNPVIRVKSPAMNNAPPPTSTTPAMYAK